MPDESIDVLFVDDSDDDVQRVVLELRNGGFDVIYERVDTESATMAALSKQNRDFILLDFSIPGLSGLTVLAMLKKIRPETPTIIVSEAVGEEKAVQAILAGARDYVLKDHLSRLSPVLRRELDEARNRRAQRSSEDHPFHPRKMDAERGQLDGIAHDFNSIFSAVVMYCDLTLDELGDPISLQATVSEMKKVIARGASLTKQLFLLSRKQSVQPAERDLKISSKRQEPSPSVSSETILLVEDEPALRNWFTRSLRNRGYRVVSASSAEKAIPIFKKHQDVIGLLLTDVSMTGMDGVTLASTLISIKPGIKILYMSGYADEHLKKYPQHNRNGFQLIEKPFSIDALCEAVKIAFKAK